MGSFFNINSIKPIIDSLLHSLNEIYLHIKYMYDTYLLIDTYIYAQIPVWFLKNLHKRAT